MNKDKLTGSFSTDGNPLLVAGVNVDLQGFGAFSGKWTIKQSTHSISREGGYVTDVEIRKGAYKKTIQKVSTSAQSSDRANWADLMGIR